MDPDLHRKLLDANKSILANIARGAPLIETLTSIVNGIEALHHELSVAILLLDEHDKRLHLGAAPGLPPSYLRALDSATIDQAAWADRPAADAALEQVDEAQFWQGFREMALQHGLHVRLAVPLYSATTRMLGILGAYSHTAEPASGLQRQSILDMTALASIAIERSADEARISRTEKSRHEDFTRMALAIDGSGTGIWDRNVATGEIHYSSGWKALFGYAEDEVTNRIEDSYTRVHPDELAYVQSTMQAHFEQQTESYAVEHRLRCKDGSYKWVSSRGKVVSRDSDGKPLRMIGTTTDITAMRALSERLQQSVDLITSLTNEVPGFIFQYRLLPNGHAYFSYASEGIRDTYEVSPEQVADNVSLIHKAVHPDDFAYYRASIEASAANLTPWHLEYRVILPRQGIRWHQGDARPRRLADGSIQWHGFVTDITERRRAEEEMQLATLVYKVSSEAMMVTDANGTIITVNPAFTQMTGYTPDEVIGKTPRILSSGRHDRAFYQAMWQAMISTGKWQGEIMDRRKDGSVYPKWLTINTTSGEGTSGLRRVAQFYDMTEKKKSEEVIWRQANFDTLTGLPNRQMFMDRLGQEIKKSHRADLPLALMFLDLDRFKEVNDTLGHDIGDVLLKQTAERLSNCVRDSDTVARLGGDEFTIILGEQNDIGCVERIAQEILRKLAKPFQLGNEAVYLTTSIGITFYPADADSVDALIKNADQAMYAAKNLGRNRYHYFTRAMQEAAQTRMRLANDLHGALVGNQLRVYYQPIVDLSTGQIHKAEALIRWQHPTRGLVNPADFIPIAEDTGMIIDIGDWVFRAAARQVMRWRESHHAAFQISINASPVQFHNDSTLHIAWPAYLDQLGLHGDSIVVEITESSLMEARATVIDHLIGFRDAGIQLSLDDFGTGYSSLSYLKKFDIDYLKIDQSFVQNLSRDSEDMVLSEAIIVMAHKLGIKVVAEGVETAEQRDLLAAAGCDYAQGYLYARPLPAEEFEAFLARQIAPLKPVR